MKPLQFSVSINAPAQKVWDALWSNATYPEWTKFFAPGSQMESDWKAGGRTLFTDDKGNGMISTIKTIDVPYAVVFEHLGYVTDGVDDTTSEKVKAYAGALEKYALTEQNGSTKLEVAVDTLEAHESMMNNGFAKGLQVVKELAENK